MSEVKLKKCTIKYMNNEFIIKKFDYDTQYNQIYKSRIQIMRNMMETSAKIKWGNEVPIVRVMDIADNHYSTNTKLVIIGTLIKQMRLQPSILNELSEEKQHIQQPILNNYTSDDDFLWLQDGDEIIEIGGNIDVSTHVTGICVAIIGNTLEAINLFNVEDFCYAAHSPTKQKNVICADQYIAIISGLGFSQNMETNLELCKGLNMFKNYIRGELTAEFSAKQIYNVIIAGNYIGINAREQEMQSENEKYFPHGTRRVVSQTINATKLFDRFAHCLAQMVSLDIMPGDLDATTQLLPQQPLHSCIFKKSKHLSSINCVTNPHCAQYNGRVILGTSGQNIKSLLQYSRLSDEMEAMRKTLEWSHIAPTCPDTLHCYPYVEKDPFVITKYPDLYFAGNQKEYRNKIFEASSGKKVVMISVPIFETNLTCVLVNLNTLNCELLYLA